MVGAAVLVCLAGAHLHMHLDTQAMLKLRNMWEAVQEASMHGFMLISAVARHVRTHGFCSGFDSRG